MAQKQREIRPHVGKGVMFIPRLLTTIIGRQKTLVASSQLPRQQPFQASFCTDKWDRSGDPPGTRVALGNRCKPIWLVTENIWSKHPLVAPDIGLSCGLEKINSRTITTSKQPLCTEKALPSVFWKEVLSRVSPAQLSCRLESHGVSRPSPTTLCPPVAQSLDGTKDTHCL